MRNQIEWESAPKTPTTKKVGVINCSDVCLVRIQSKNGKKHFYELCTYSEEGGWSNGGSYYKDKFEVTHWAVVNKPEDKSL